MQPDNKPFYSHFDRFNGPIHAMWRADRTHRARMPMHLACRGVLGVGVRQQPGAALARASRTLVPNEALTWFRVVDLPAGHFPGCPAMNRRDVTFASSTQAALRFGNVHLDFTRGSRDTWDLRFMPYAAFTVPEPWGDAYYVPQGDTLDCGAYPREFEMLTRLSVTMTEAAYYGQCRERPLDTAWFMRRPHRHDDGLLFEAPVPECWWPRPFLVFDAKIEDRLFLAATTQPEVAMYTCPACHRAMALTELERSEGFEVHDAGFFVACPRCGADQMWFLAEEWTTPPTRLFPETFCDDFCSAVRERLPLIAPCDCFHIGHVTPTFAQETYDTEVSPGLVPHVFQATGTDQRVERFVLPLLPNSQLDIRPLQELKAGQPFGYALPATPPAEWSRLPRMQQWTTLGQVLGHGGLVGPMQSLWFKMQSIRLGARVAYPADLVCYATACTVEPEALCWDMSPAQPYWVDACESYVLPALRRRSRYSMRDIDINFGIGDPRYDEVYCPQPGKPLPAPAAVMKQVAIEARDCQVDAITGVQTCDAAVRAAARPQPAKVHRLARQLRMRVRVAGSASAV